MTEDILFFFDREPQALSLFELLCEQAMARCRARGCLQLPTPRRGVIRTMYRSVISPNWMMN